MLGFDADSSSSLDELDTGLGTMDSTHNGYDALSDPGSAREFADDELAGWLADDF